MPINSTKAVATFLSDDNEKSIEIDVKLKRKNSNCSSRKDFIVKKIDRREKKSKTKIEKPKPVKKTGIQIFS